jgi:FkbM family methyltransferase
MSKFELIAGKFFTNLTLDWKFMRLGFLSLSEKIAYLMTKYWAMIANKKSVNFCGITFNYDNRWTPALLQSYPSEIQRLDASIQMKCLDTVLDIGANIGQFGTALAQQFPHINTYSFEPNPVIFSLLSRNALSHQHWRVFNFGISSEEAQYELYFVPGKSAQGSVMRNNADLNLMSEGEIISVPVKLRPLSKTLLEEQDLPSFYDLVKIDVEGAEAAVIRGLKDIRWRYLYIECSLNREGRMELSDLIRIVKETWGIETKLVYRSSLDSKSSCYDVILENESST